MSGAQARIPHHANFDSCVATYHDYPLRSSMNDVLIAGRGGAIMNDVGVQVPAAAYVVKAVMVKSINGLQSRSPKNARRKNRKGRATATPKRGLRKVSCPKPKLSSLSNFSPASPLQLTNMEELAKAKTQEVPSFKDRVHTLDDISLLNIFRLYRPFLLGENEGDYYRVDGGSKNWIGEHWWYTPAHVCQRWRNLIFGSSSYLGLCLACTAGTPVADMLAHSHPLPLVIDYGFSDDDSDNLTAKDEEEFTLAFQERNRVRRIRLFLPILTLKKLAITISKEYPILEYLILATSADDPNTISTLLESFQAPHLRHLALFDIAFPIGFRSPTTTASLVTLALIFNSESTYQPSGLFQWISSMPQLETFVFSIPKCDLEMQSTHTPTLTHITLPNLRWFSFDGASADLEVVVSQITTPRLEKLDMALLEQPVYSAPHLVQFINATENVKFRVVRLFFSNDHFYMGVYPAEDAETYSFCLSVMCQPFDRQIASLAQIFDASSQTFSAVEHLSLEQDGDNQEQDAVDRSQLHEFLGSFSNVKTLRVNDWLVRELFRSVRSDDGGNPVGLFPKLRELRLTGGCNANDVMTLGRRSPSPSSSRSE